MAAVSDLRCAYDGLFVTTGLVCWMSLWFVSFSYLLLLMLVADDVYALLADVGGGSGTYTPTSQLSSIPLLTFTFDQWQTEPNQY